MNRHQRRASAKLAQTPSQPGDPLAAALLQVGVSHHQVGRFADAEACYRKILAAQPNHADALHLLGLVAHQAGQLDRAVELIRLALLQNGQNAVYLANLGVALRDQGKFDEAVTACRQATRIKPDFAEAYSTLGVALRCQGKLGEANSASRQSIHIKPDYAEGHSNLGSVLHDQGKFDEAIAAFREAIRIKPDIALFYFNLGAALQECRKSDEAAASYRQAIRIKSDYAEAHSNLGAVLRDQDRLDEAIAAQRQAIRIKPDLATAYSNLGAALHDQGKLDEAVEAYRQAIVLKSNLDAAHGNLGSALVQIGRLAEGRAALERAAELAPRNPRHLRYLAEYQHFAPGDPRLAALEQLAQDGPMLSVDDRIELHFALGKAYDDIARHQEAFRQFRDGNALKRKQIAYDEAAMLGVLDRIRRVFTSDLMRTWRDAGHPSSVPIFVVGMPRSGTTLVEQILASHPQVFGGGELKNLDRAIQQVRPSFGTSSMFPEVALNMRGPDFRELGARYLAEIRQLAPAAEHVVDKMPANFRVAGLIHLAMPNAAIIHVVRDPIDTCLSCFSKLFTDMQAHTYDLAELGRYFLGYRKLMAHWHRVLPAGRILDIRYEDVVADLEGQARRIVGHCGLGWEPRCLAFHQTERPIRTASAMQVRQPIYSTAVGRWRRYEPYLKPLLNELEHTNLP